MNSMKIKKTLIKLLPYIIVGLVCTNLGEAWRLAEGADMGKKMLSFFSMVGVAAGTALRGRLYLLPDGRPFTEKQ